MAIFIFTGFIQLLMNITALNNNLNFTAGKTKILSDFDGTFMPKEFGHDIICNDNPPVDKEAFSSYFDAFSDFFDSQNKDEKKTELTISTGRNMHEFNYYMKKIKQKGLSVPNPDKLIITNGGDEFIRKGEDYFSSDSKKNMFSYADLNKQKRGLLKRFTVSYYPSQIKKQVRNMLRSLNGSPKVLEPKTHQGMYGYKDNMTLQERVERQGNITDYVSMRQDGFYQIRMTAPVGSEHIEELKEISSRLQEDGYKLKVSINENDGETCVNTVDDPEKWQLGTSVEMKPETRGKVKILDKFHHAKIMADDIIKNNSDDLVIVSGDGGNDLDMLNLSNYIDSMSDISDFSKPEFLDEVSKLPVISIFVRNSASLDDKIQAFEENFNFDGVKRFIVVDKDNPERPSTLLDAIKLAQEEYSKINPEYKRNLE